MITTTLRPGLLVALATRLRGGVEYERRDLENDTAEDGSKLAKWETTRTITDPAEYERAGKLRGKCRSLIASVCAPSDFGLLCPQDREDKLNEAIEAATKLANEFNETARHSTITIYVLKGRVASDDTEAIRAINSEVTELLTTMERGVATANPESIREAANRARQLGTMLSDDARFRVNVAIEQARENARALVKRVQKSGELAATVVSECKVDAIQNARFAFLDLDGADKVAVPVPIQARGLDLMPAVEES